VTDLAYKICMGALGSVATLMRIHRPTVLCLHSVAPPRSQSGFRSRLSVDEEFLAMIAATVRKQNIPLISLTDAVARLRAGDLSPFLVLTFDDGYRDNYYNLFKVAKIHDIPFTIFITTGLIDREVPMWWDTLERLDASSDRPKTGRGIVEDPALIAVTKTFRRTQGSKYRQLFEQIVNTFPSLADHSPYDQALTWPMLREMLGSGLLTVGAHTVTHSQLSSLSAVDVRMEFNISRQRIQEELNVEAKFLAYPYGQPQEIGPLAASIAREEGYSAAFTTTPRPLRKRDVDDLFHLPRILLSNKTQNRNTAMAYLSGLAAVVKTAIGQGALS